MAGSPFAVEVDGIGSFTFRRRTIRDQFRIEAEANRMLGGPVEDDMLKMGAAAFATLLALTVEAPPGWDIEAFDPLDDVSTARVFLVHRRLRETEATFRAGTGGAGAGTGKGAGG